MPSPVPDPFDPELLIGVWFGIDPVPGSLGMLQFRFNRDGTFQFANSKKGEFTSGTYAVIGAELVLQNRPDGAEVRRPIISYRPDRVVFGFPEVEKVLDFHRDRPAL